MHARSATVAVVGMACVYPDARTPGELWENVLAQRRAFRRIPAERLRIEDYYAAERTVPDATYSAEAAVIEGYEFDRVKFRVVGSTYRSADLAHWLALDVAAQALADAGFAEGQGIPRETMGVILANTLTGEFSRAALLRYRWPYVRRNVEAELAAAGWGAARRATFLGRLEERYKAPFAPVGEESLAGGLSNTIAGRICNQFDFKGGGYTVDGACASSLVAVATACSSLVGGDLDVALAGGVDLSLDPFELLGFAKAGALAPDEMRVYDARSTGFWPGEGCGFLVLMRQEDALAQGLRIYALVRGWGISSDGGGGMTRPEEAGQLLALERAYRRAGFAADSPAYFEGHGTGTAVGDATELRVLTRARLAAGSQAPAAAIGSVKANIGHTKAAAGVAGLIKATLAVQRQVLPPVTGCERPHPELLREPAVLRLVREAEPWPEGQPLRAGVSSMGFGGINAHVVIEGASGERRRSLSPRERRLGSSVQDAELVLFQAADAAALGPEVDAVGAVAHRLSRAELADLAANSLGRLASGAWRAAVVASRPAELAARTATLAGWLAEGMTERIDPAAGIFLGHRPEPGRIGFLFPGQGSPANLGGGVWCQRFPGLGELLRMAMPPGGADAVATEVVQPAIVRASLAGLQVLGQYGIEANLAIGHSLGEVTALHWAGVFDAATVQALAVARGQAMAALGDPTGAMAGIEAGPVEVRRLIEGTGLVIAGLNSPLQTVVSGPAVEVDRVLERARAAGVRGVRLAVSHAFHSPAVAAARGPLEAWLAQQTLHPLRRRVVSTVTGLPLGPDEDITQLLGRQVISPVRFIEAVAQSLDRCDAFIEVGPGHVLGGLLGHFTGMTRMRLRALGFGDVPLVPPAVSLDVGGGSISGLLSAVGAAFALGLPVATAALAEGRATKPLAWPWSPKFFANPCEMAPLPDSFPASEADALPDGAAGAEVGVAAARAEGAAPASAPVAGTEPAGVEMDLPAVLGLVRQLVAERAELPVPAVGEGSRLLADLHLNSISVGELVADAARRIGLPPLTGLNDFAHATVSGVAQALFELKQTGGGGSGPEPDRVPAGVDFWVRAFGVHWEPAPVVAANAPAVDWRVLAPAGHPWAEGLPGRLREAAGPIARAAGGDAAAIPPGVLVFLPPDSPEQQAVLLLEASRVVLARSKDARLVVIQTVQGGGGFARTLFLEARDAHVTVVTVPADAAGAAEWVVTEAMATRGYREVRYDAQGVRSEPHLQLFESVEASGERALGPADVLLVTGGGKGIAAECALALARRTGARLVLCGRSRPEADTALQANLDRLTAAGVDWRYFAADVTDPVAVRHAVDRVATAWGPVTGLLHGAGTNMPQTLATLDLAAMERTLGPKVVGLRNILAAVRPDRLRLVVTFSSIIARSGLAGEADYAFANEWLTRLTEEFQAAHPACRCLALEWSVWSGVGMGERLGSVDALLRAGITPITPDQGVALLERLVAAESPPTTLVVAGRFGDLPTLSLGRPELPFWRFLEKPLVYYPGIELVAESRLSPESDPYLDDHVYHGERLFPAVLGLEAMAQVAMALTGSKERPDFEAVELDRPVVVPWQGTHSIRVAGLVRGPGNVVLTLRSETTGYQADHFRAVCRFSRLAGVPGACAPQLRPPLERCRVEAAVALDTQADVYDALLFHTGRFFRVASYDRLRARDCEVVLRPPDPDGWFGPYLPADLVLGDPGARDAGMHAIQACIPQARLLPVGVAGIQRRPAASPGIVRIQARERQQDGLVYVYDVDFLSETDEVVEAWTGLRLRRLEDLPQPSVWPGPLLANYLERKLGQWLPPLSIALGFGDPRERLARGTQLIASILGRAVRLSRRPDGRPEVAWAEGSAPDAVFPAVSLAHAAGLTFAVAGTGPDPVGCDVEPVQARSSAVWLDLLGADRFALAGFVAAQAAEDLDVAGTRVWTVRESLRKAGFAETTPLVFDSAGTDGWVRFRSGSRVSATLATRVRGAEGPVVFACVGGQVGTRVAERATSGAAGAAPHAVGAGS